MRAHFVKRARHRRIRRVENIQLKLLPARGRLRGTGLRRWSGQAMIGARVMKLQRELSPPVFVVVARRLRISAQIIFFPAQGVGGARKGGAGLR